MKVSNFDKRMFKAAKEEAMKSDYKRFHVGAVIVYGHTIIGRGRNGNKSHPMQKVYNKKYRKFNSTEGKFILDSIHAEIMAISNISYVVGKEVDFSKAKIYVYRICKGKKNGYGNAKPCPACMNAIRDLGIKTVMYTDDDGLNCLELY